MQIILLWMRGRLVHIPEYDRRSGVWFLIVCWLASSGVAVVIALGNPTGASLFSQLKNIAMALGLNSLGFIIGTVVLALLFSIIYLPLPRLGLGSLLYTMAMSVGVLIYNKSGVLFSYIAGIGYSLIAVLIGLLIVLLIRKNKIAIIVTVLVVLGFLGNGAYSLVADNIGQHTSQVAVHQIEDPAALNPGKEGDFDYTFFTYGSGDDLHRKEFGSEVDELTETVDASSWLTNWNEKRTDFWGFDSSALPINGRTWLPEGEGPFPVILIVHGNHTMEYFSTDGYDYLGEQLASRGFLTISVDEDFINYSNVSGIPNDNYTLRAWVLLQHLIQLKQMNQVPDSKLSGKVNLDQVALVGHSRGGQAALMATDYTNFFDDELLFDALDSIHIQAVATLAPTDKTIDRKKPQLHDVSYFSMQGARDADVNNFRGDRQFYRTSFSGAADAVKSTLYIEGANHTQFNSSWGRMDVSLPRGIFLNQLDTMPASEQRQIAQVYLSAFFERVFYGDSTFEQLLEIHEYGKDWLPDTTMVSKYREAGYRPIMQFHKGDTKNIAVEGFTHWDITTPVERGGTKQLQDALLLEWENEAKYTLDLSQETLKPSAQSHTNRLVLTMANLDEEGDESSTPDIDVELKTSDGIAVRIPLEEFMPFPPVISIDFTPFGWFDEIFRDGKYDPSWEPVFQTFAVPFERFKKTHPDFVKDNITSLSLHFNSRPGKIYIEEIGVQ